MADAERVIERLKYIIGDLVVENSIQKVELEEHGELNTD